MQKIKNASSVVLRHHWTYPYGEIWPPGATFHYLAPNVMWRNLTPN